MILLLVAFVAYFVGSLPFGFWIARLYGVDIRSAGSGNIGATNVLRVLGWGPGIIVFLLDVAKGYGPAFVTGYLVKNGTLITPEWLTAADASLYSGLLAVIGHSLSPFLKFRGGKGVATALGGVLGAYPLVAGSGFAAFLVIVLLTRYVSLASIIGIGVAVAMTFILPSSIALKIVVALLWVFVTIRHRENIKRLLNGTEPKFGKKSAQEPPKNEVTT